MLVPDAGIILLKDGSISFKEFCYDVRPVVIAEAGVLDADVIAVLGSITFARKILAIDGVTVASVARPVVNVIKLFLEEIWKI